MYLPSVRSGSWNHALASGKLSSFGRVGSAGAVDFCHHHRHGLLRPATDTCRAFSGDRFASGQAEESVRSERERQYTSWSPSTSKNTSLNLPATEDMQQQPRRQQPPAAAKPVGARPSSPQAVSMEEFAALERKLAPPVAVEPPRRRTPEQIAMEEFAALERKLSPPPSAAAPLRTQGGSRGARPTPLTKPEVSVRPWVPRPRLCRTERYVDELFLHRAWCYACSCTFTGTKAGETARYRRFY